MRKKLLVLLFIASATYSCSIAWAASNVSQKITFSVQAINEIVINNTISILDIKTENMNYSTTKIINAVSTYSITTNEVNKKITGVLNTVLPKDASLKITLEAPAGAKSCPNVSLTETPTDLVTGVTKTAESGKTIFYQFSAPESSQWDTPLPQIVTLTITE